MNREFIVVHGAFDGEPIIIFTDTIVAIKRCINEEVDRSKYETIDIHTGLSGCFSVKETMSDVLNKLFKDNSIPHSRRRVSYDPGYRCYCDTFEKFMEGDKNNG